MKSEKCTIAERFQRLKEKRKEWKEAFREKHPVAAENIMTAKVVLGVIAVYSVPFIAGYSIRKSEEDQNRLFEDVEKGLDRISTGPKDYIDEEGKYHEDIGYGCFAVWPDSDSYLEAQHNLVEHLKSE